MRAYCLIRPQPWYRREAFVCGLRAAGYTVFDTPPAQAAPGDVLVIWNRYGHWHDTAVHFEQQGGTVIVAENGYLGRGGSTPKYDVHPAGPQADHYYALAVGGHNGSGRWPRGEGDAARWEALGIPLQPWRKGGSHILVCPSRFFGSPVMQPPGDWLSKTVNALREITDLPLRVRDHPGNHAPARPLAEDLEDARAVVIWASSAGVHALVAGVPVVCTAPHWICKVAAFSEFSEFNQLYGEPRVMNLLTDYRLDALDGLACAQWTVREIETGEPFRRLLA